MSFKFPYRNLKKEAEVEMVGADDLHLRRIDLTSNPSSHVTISNGNSDFVVRSKQCSLFTVILSCTVAAGVQFGWALQLSLLTPYIQVCFPSLRGSGAALCFFFKVDQFRFFRDFVKFILIVIIKYHRFYAVSSQLDIFSLPFILPND